MSKRTITYIITGAVAGLAAAAVLYIGTEALYRAENTPDTPAERTEQSTESAETTETAETAENQL